MRISGFSLSESVAVTTNLNLVRRQGFRLESARLPGSTGGRFSPLVCISPYTKSVYLLLKHEYNMTPEGFHYILVEAMAVSSESMAVSYRPFILDNAPLVWRMLP